MNKMRAFFVIAPVAAVLLSLASFSGGDENDPKKIIETYMTTMETTRSVEVSVPVNVPRMEVWNRITTIAGLNSWWTTESMLDQTIGSRHEYTWEMNGAKHTGYASNILSRPPEAYSIQWQGAFDPVNFMVSYEENEYPFVLPITTHFTLREDAGNKTLVMVKTSGIKGDSKYNDYFDSVGQQWKIALANLKSVCEKNRDLRKDLGTQMFMGLY